MKTKTKKIKKGLKRKIINLNKRTLVKGPVEENCEDLDENDFPVLEEPMFEEDRRIEIDRSLATLTKIEESVLRYFFGLGVEKMSMDEIGKRLNLSRERIRQIKEKAINRIKRSYSRRKLLVAYC